MDPREAALRVLAGESGASRGRVFSSLKDNGDRALAENLVNGTTKWKALLDHCLAPFSKRSLPALAPRVLAALRIGAYQLLIMGLPSYASVCTAVDCLRDRGHRSYANGVLRAFARNAGHVEMPDLDENPLLYAALRFSYPEWITRLFVGRFGFSEALWLSDWGNRPPPLVLRVNARRTSAENFIGRLSEEGITAQLGRVPGAVRLNRGTDVTALPGFREGDFLVQDEAAMVAPLVLGAKPGEAVWDACAAPGGKTEHLAELMGGAGVLLATDIDDRRLELIRDTVGRMGFPFVDVRQADVERGAPGRFQGETGFLFDRILLDAPCSGLGVIRRNADLRWNRRESDIPAMARRQRALLSAARSWLKPGGVLVYSTCTLTTEENEETWASFLEEAPDMVPEDPAELAPPAVAGLFSGGRFAGPGYRYLLPQYAATDGFFVARAKKERGGCERGR